MIRADVLLAAVVALVGQQEVWLPASGFDERVRPLPAMAVGYLVAAVALSLRRRAPLLCTALVTTALSALCLTSGAPDGLGSLLPLLVALYSVTRWSSVPHSLAGAALVAGATAVHEATDPRFVFDGRTVGTWCVVAAAGVIGAVLQARAHEADRVRQLAAEAERARISAELHDLVGHGMSLGVLQVSAAQTTLEAGQLPDTERRLAELEGTLRSTLDEVRRLLAVTGRDQVAPREPQPGLEEIPDLVARVEAAGVPATLANRVRRPLPAGVALVAYRVVQESLTNVMRHARAPVRVTVDDAGDRLLVVVADEGPGAAELTGGSGIAGMRRRVELYGGRLELASAPGRGVTVTAVLPLPVPG